MHLRRATMLAACLFVVSSVACDGDKNTNDDTDTATTKKKKKKDDGDADGCAKDTDCKGERVCTDGKCVAPSGQSPAAPSQAAPGPVPVVVPPPVVPPPVAPLPTPAPPPTPGPVPDSGGSNGPAPSPFVSFTPVDAEVWTPRLGPKMLAGSKVVHTVFEGPFGPSPKSLFAVTERPDRSYYVYVMGDDNKPWPAGPLAEKGTWLAHKITAVSFFDADKNGTTDALVMAVYKGRAGDIRNRNVLLKWTNLGMRRLLNLEPKIEFMDSAEAIQRKLAQ